MTMRGRPISAAEFGRMKGHINDIKLKKWTNEVDMFTDRLKPDENTWIGGRSCTLCAMAG